MLEPLRGPARGLLARLLRRLPSKRLFNLIRMAVLAYNAKSGERWVSLVERPRRTEAIDNLWSGARLRGDLPKTGVVVQGPLLAADQFTVETFALYRRSIPHAQIIFSTWRGEDAAALEHIRGLGVLVVENEKPATPGPQNMNFQVVSAREGVRAALAAGCEYVLKQRSDQRIYRYHPDVFLLALTRSFGPAHPGLRSRIVVNDVYTRAFWPMHLADHISFGHVTDLMDYWDCPLSDDKKGRWPKWEEPSAPITELLSSGWNAEAWLLTHFLRKRGIAVDYSLGAWWEVLAQVFVVIDNTVLDIFWPKYDTDVERKFADAYEVLPQQTLGFYDWVMLKDGKLPSERFDQSLRHNLLQMDAETFRRLTAASSEAGKKN